MLTSLDLQIYFQGEAAEAAKEAGANIVGGEELIKQVKWSLERQVNFKCTLLVSSQEAIGVPLSAVIVKGGVLINLHQSSGYFSLYFPFAPASKSAMHS